MSITILRADGAWWIQRGDRAARLASEALTTAALLADRSSLEAAAASPSLGFDTPVSDLYLESPVTTPCRVVAQMVNYRTHARESGFDPTTVQPTFFRKSSGSITGPTGEVIKPTHTQLLDYEVELGLVIGAPVPVGTLVTDHNIHDYVAGVVVTNDISARDIQLTKGQFYESKSYPTFTPVGPALVLLEADDFPRLPDVRLTLRVNGVVRQDRPATDMIHLPTASLTALARFQRLEPGDLVLTGTPGGTALQAPSHAVEFVAKFLPAEVKWKVFFDKQAKNPKYLRPGDRVSASIRTDDGHLDLGSQDCLVVAQ